MRRSVAETGSAPSRNTGPPPEATLRVVRDLLAAWNSRVPGRIASLYAPHYEGVDVGQAEPRRGPGDVEHTAEAYLRAFPDLRFEQDEVILQENRAVLVWTAHGTHRGALMRIPPTGRNITVRGTSVLTIEGGRITRGLHVWDVAGLLRCLGLLPEL